MKTLFPCFAPLSNKPAILVAVSGGVDSMVLLSALHEWCKLSPNAPKLYVASVNHNLRADAKQECELVENWCNDKNVSRETLYWNHEGNLPKTKLMEQARNARYKLLEAHAAALKIEYLITAHHADDQAETLFMRLARGSGLTGLCAMHDERMLTETLTLVRPFLAVEKAELLKIALENDIPFIQDPSNNKTQFERVRMRETLQKSEISAAHLQVSVKRLQRAEHALMDITESFLSHCEQDGAGLKLAREFYDHTPAEIQIRLLMSLAQQIGAFESGEYPISLSSFERLHGEFSHAELDATTRRTVANCEISLSPNWLKIKLQTPRNS